MGIEGILGDFGDNVPVSGHECGYYLTPTWGPNPPVTPTEG